MTNSVEEIPDGSRVPVLSAAAIPDGVDEQEADEIRRKAVQVVAQLREATGAKELEVIDAITAVGMQSQRQAGRDLDLLRVRVGDMMGREGSTTSDRIARDLTELRVVLNRIDPQRARDDSLVRRAIGALPFGRDQMLKGLERLAVRYEPISKQVALLEVRLREGRMLLGRDNIELRKLYEQVEAQQVVVQKNRYLGELIMEELSALVEQGEDSAKTQRGREALLDVAVRVQDLRTMEEVHRQLFVSIEMTRKNNTRLGQAVERALTMVSNVVMIGLAIQSALARQERVLEAAQGTREYLGDILVANARSVRDHTAEIGDVYNSPVIALEKVTQAHNDLLEAIETADRLKIEGIVAARENIRRLTELSAGIGTATPPLLASAAPSLEA
jgi:uncharacterized protein YaaN involved in tellurite resistance